MSACNWEIPPLHTQCGSPLAHRLGIISNLCSNPGFPNIALGSTIRLIARLPQASENVEKLWLCLRMQICPKLATCSITFIRFIYKYLVWGSKQGGLWETELRWLFWWDKVIGTEAEKLCRWNPISRSWVAVVQLHFNITVCLQPWFDWCLEIFHLSHFSDWLSNCDSPHPHPCTYSLVSGGSFDSQQKHLAYWSQEVVMMHHHTVL